MTLREAVETLVLGDGRKLPVLGTRGLRKLFSSDDDSAFAMGLRWLVEIGLLERIARGVYLNMAAPEMGRRGVGTIVNHLRPGHTSYLSYESALAEFGSISQVPFVFIVATTGNSGECRTRYGDIEFTHTSRPQIDILRNTEYDDRIHMLVASPEMAYEDLRRVRPAGLHLVDEEAHAQIVAEWRTN